MNLNDYRTNRDALLARINQVLKEDERFVAAWLTGSYGRNEEDDVSDLDLTVVVADSHADTLCNRSGQSGPQTTEERLKLFSLIGTPAAIHENNHNAPERGTFTFVFYTPSAIMVDWTLIPQSQAQRPLKSRLLFDKSGIPLYPPEQAEGLEDRLKRATDILPFFWMMAAVTSMYILRQDRVFVINWLEELNKMLKEVERLIAGQPPTHQRGSLSKFEPTTEGQRKALYQLCERMEMLMPELEKIGGHVPPSPKQEIESLLNLDN